MHTRANTTKATPAYNPACGAEKKGSGLLSRWLVISQLPEPAATRTPTLIATKPILFPRTKLVLRILLECPTVLLALTTLLLALLKCDRKNLLITFHLLMIMFNLVFNYFGRIDSMLDKWLTAWLNHTPQHYKLCKTIINLGFFVFSNSTKLHRGVLELIDHKVFY